MRPLATHYARPEPPRHCATFPRAVPVCVLQMAQLGAMMAAGGGGGGGGGGGTVVRLTADEAAAVERLMELGFDRNRAVEAYLACDKDEAAAANFLLEGGGLD